MPLHASVTCTSLRACAGTTVDDAIRVTELTATFTGRASGLSELIDLPGVPAMRPVSSTSLALTLTGAPGPVLNMAPQDKPASRQRSAHKSPANRLRR